MGPALGAKDKGGRETRAFRRLQGSEIGKGLVKKADFLYSIDMYAGGPPPGQQHNKNYVVSVRFIRFSCRA